MAKWAVVDFGDLLFVGSVLARAAHPELIVHQWTTGHNACRELGVTVWASLTPVRNHSLTGGALCLVAARIFRRMLCEYF